MYEDYFKSEQDIRKEQEDYHRAKNDEKKRREEEFLKFQRQQDEAAQQLQREVELTKEKLKSSYQEFSNEAQKNGILRGLWKGMKCYISEEKK